MKTVQKLAASISSKNKFSILFRPRKSKAAGNDSIVIYCRLTLGGIRCKSDFSTGVKVPAGNWNQKNQTILGRGYENENLLLQAVKNKLADIYTALISSGQPITAEHIKALFLDAGNTEPSFLSTLEFLLQEKQQEIGIRITESSLVSYQTRVKFIREFLHEKGKGYILTSELNEGIIKTFIRWAEVNRGVSGHWVYKCVGVFKQAVSLALRKGWIDKNPIFGVSAKKAPANFPECLAEEVIHAMVKHKYKDSTLQKVNDAALFQIFSGFDYCDLADFTRAKHLKKDATGWHYLEKERNKKAMTASGMVMTVPISPGLQRILDKYEGGNPLVMENGTVLSYEHYRRGLLMLTEIHESKVRITAKTLRKTFGMRMLEAGVSLEVVSKMMGHNNLRTTETYYAKIQNTRLIRETSHIFAEVF